MTIAPNESPPAETVRTLRAHIDAALQSVVAADEPASLYDPVRYVLRGGGKRLRPVFLLISARSFGVDESDALPAALGVEVFHNFTLVHDDIMDHAGERRGRPTIHEKWDESTAILCGDYLMGLAFALLARFRSGDAAALVARFHEMVTHLCEGQALDKEFETRRVVSVDEYLRMVDLKTGELLRTSLVLGGMLGNAGARELETLGLIGENIGRAFQIADDLLDLTADHDRWGKRVGGDLIQGKKTYILLRAIERAGGTDREWLLNIVRENGLAAADVDEARERIRRSGVLDEARNEVLRYSGDALATTYDLPESPAVETLRWLIGSMQERLH